MLTDDFVRDGVVVEMNDVHLLAGSLGGLLDGVSDFVRLTKAPTDATVLVATDDESTEAETAATFDDLRTAVDVNDFFDGVALTGIACIFCHNGCGGGIRTSGPFHGRHQREP